jgi:MFS family permease
MRTVGWSDGALGRWIMLLTNPQDSSWRGPLAIQCVPALIVLLAMKWLPESPRYLIMKGRDEDARKVLNRLHEHDEAVVEFNQIEAQIRIDHSLPHSWMSLIQKRSYRIRTYYALGLACGIQFTGVLVINSTLTRLPAIQSGIVQLTMNRLFGHHLQ